MSFDSMGQPVCRCLEASERMAACCGVCKVLPLLSLQRSLFNPLRRDKIAAWRPSYMPDGAP